MQGRIYSVPVIFASEGADFDLAEIIAPANGIIALAGVKLAQTTVLKDANELIVELEYKRATGTYTTGSGGTTPTPVAGNQGDIAASFTAKVSNSTQAVVGTGTLVTYDYDGWNLRSPYLWLPPERLWFNSLDTDALIISMTDPGTAVNLGGSVLVEELGT